MLKTYKFRLYPTKNQEVLLEKHIGTSRFVYNFFLNYSTNCYKNTKTSTNYYNWANQLTRLKKTEKYSWLNEINSQSLQASLKNLDKAYKCFFKKQGGYPNFKSRHKAKWSFEVPQNVKLELSETNDKFGYLVMPKFIKSPIKTRVHRIMPIDYKIKTATIVKSRTNKYYVSLVLEYQPQGKLSFNTLDAENSIGIDMGIADTLILSNGEKYNFPINSKKYDKKLRHCQKSLARKYRKNQPHSKNFEKARVELAKVYEKISNIKDNWIHQTTKKLIAENQSDYYFLENLNIQGMSKNHKLAKAVLFQSWYKFKEVLSYKAKYSGKEVVSIGRFEPSTKTCSNCGHINNDLTLKDRSWICPECQSEHERDINAAINIRNFGIKQLAAV